jgi:hypothetical protein
MATVSQAPLPLPAFLFVFRTAVDETKRPNRSRAEFGMVLLN